MDLNQVTVEVRDIAQGVSFCKRLGFRLIVLSEGHYARFELPSRAATFSLHVAEAPAAGGSVLYFEVADVDRVHQ